MSLSDKIEEVQDRKGFEYGVITTEDIKEFIKELKESFCKSVHKRSCNVCRYCKWINKLAGDALVNKSERGFK